MREEELLETVSEELDEAAEEACDAGDSFIDKANRFAEQAKEFTYSAYMEPQEKSIVEPKRSYLIIGICSALLLLLAFGSFFFFGLYPYHTTGVTVNEFIDNYNSIVSDTSILALLPDYEDVRIPEGAKLGGKKTIEVWDGHVVISAKTRFGKIVELKTEAVDVPYFDNETHHFVVPADTNEHFYYFVALGKILLAFDMAMEPQEEEAEPVTATDVSSGDVSASDAAEEEPMTAINAAAYGYNVYKIACEIYNEGGHGRCFLTAKDNRVQMCYDVVENSFSVYPLKKTITKLPDGLQKIADWFTPDEEPVVVPAADTSATDTSAADVA